TSRRQYDDDIHSRAQPWWSWCHEPCRLPGRLPLSRCYVSPAFVHMRYQKMRSLPPCFSTEIFQKPLRKGRLYTTPSYSVRWMKPHNVRYFLGVFRYQVVILLSG